MTKYLGTPGPLKVTDKINQHTGKKRGGRKTMRRFLSFTRQEMRMSWTWVAATEVMGKGRIWVLYLKVKPKEIAAQFHTGYEKEESRMTPKYLA